MISIFNQTYKYTYKIKHIQALTTPSRQETQHAPSLPRGVAPETLVVKDAVAEDRRIDEKRPVSGRSDTRGCLTDTCDGGARGRRPIIDRSDTRACPREHCEQGGRGRGPPEHRKETDFRMV